MRKKLITTILAVLILVGLLPLSAMAATDTCILAQPQNYVYNEGAVAIYYVTVAGENLKCTWYLDYDGKAYNLSEPGAAGPWINYVAGGCGSAEEKDNLGFTPSHTTFSYHFNGCEAGLDGAYIYAEIYDGWDSVESAKARIQLSEGAKSPPQVFVPAQMEACKGDKVELTCSAVSVYGGALSYTWYETPDGDLTKIRAIDRGAETDATLVCDTDSCGTRYYVCAVDEKDGGVTYSSVIPVTVTEEKTVDPPAEVKTQVVFTNGSTFEVGGTAAVDFLKTSQNVMNDPNIMADMYNAALEQDMDVTWICSDGAGKKGKSVAWTAEDAGKEYVCRVSFYADDELTEFIDYVDSEPFVISSGRAPVDAKLTPEGPFLLTVGKHFEQQISCNVAGVTFENYRTSFPNGIDISSNGLISGIPTEEGFWHVTIVAYKDGEQIGDLGVEFHVSAAAANEPPQITTESLPEAVVGKDYYVKLQCTDPDAAFSEYYNPGKANDLSKTGLVLTQHGELQGKPTKAGSYSFCICAAGETGEGYMTYTLVVKEAEAADSTEPSKPATEPAEETKETEGAEPPTDTVGTEPADPAENATHESSNEMNENKAGGDVWRLAAIGLGGLVIGMTVSIVVILKKKKA